MSDQTQPEETVINNLDEFLKVRGFEGETFHRWGRCLYKYTFGPWVAAQLDEEKLDEIDRDCNFDEDGHRVIERASSNIYYEDPAAGRTDWHELCSGISCGSIIEGADYDATPFYLEFPFTNEEWERCFKELDRETSEHWILNNSVYFIVYEGSEIVLSGHWVQFDDGPKHTEEGNEYMDELAMAAGEAVNEACIKIGEPIPIPGYENHTVIEYYPEMF